MPSCSASLAGQQEGAATLERAMSGSQKVLPSNRTLAHGGPPESRGRLLQLGRLGGHAAQLGTQLAGLSVVRLGLDHLR